MLYQNLDYDTVRQQNLRFMDSTAIAHCMERSMPILVFNYRKEGNIQRAVRGEKVGTLVGPKAPVADLRSLTRPLPRPEAARGQILRFTRRCRYGCCVSRHAGQAIVVSTLG